MVVELESWWVRPLYLLEVGRITAHAAASTFTLPAYETEVFTRRSLSVSATAVAIVLTAGGRYARDLALGISLCGASLFKHPKTGI